MSELKPDRTGADTLAETLVDGGVTVCFANPGTSEMHFVGALDRVRDMRCVLGLFEGVVSGAADGYYRMTGKPAATLLHLGPGFGNALANMHNARKARSGIINVIGDHATYHRGYDAPLTSDVEAIASAASDHVWVIDDGAQLADIAAGAITTSSAQPGAISSLILPADISWKKGSTPGATRMQPPMARIDEKQIEAIAALLRAGAASTTLLLGGYGVRGRSLLLAGKIAARTGCRLLSEAYSAREERGSGRVNPDRLPITPVPAAVMRLANTENLILAGAPEPVAFFAYPDQPSLIAPAGCNIIELARPGHPTDDALELLCDLVGATNTSPALLMERESAALPTGPLTPDGIGAVLAALLPEQAIVVDESVTTGRGFSKPTAQAAPHDWLSLTGGSIGFALPAAVGAAVGAPDRKVIALEGDGSGMYTIQALWTMARENLDIVIVIFANRRYEILEYEFAKMGTGTPGMRAREMLTIGNPDIDWVSLAKAQGVDAGRAETLEGFAKLFRNALSGIGPYLIQLDL